MEEEKYKLPQEIYDMAKELNALYKIAYFQIEPMASYIMNKKVKNTVMIENTLDKILNIPTDEAYELFLSLCKYYATLDKDGAKFYLDSWDEMYGEDKSDTEISIKEAPKVRKKTISD